MQLPSQELYSFTACSIAILSTTRVGAGEGFRHQSCLVKSMSNINFPVPSFPELF